MKKTIYVTTPEVRKKILLTDCCRTGNYMHALSEDKTKAFDICSNPYCNSHNKPTPLSPSTEEEYSNLIGRIVSQEAI